jgi:hypothetical protein
MFDLSGRDSCFTLRFKQYHAEAHSPGVKWKTIQAFVLGHGGSVHCDFRALERPSSRGSEPKAWIFEVWKTGGKLTAWLEVAGAARRR